ncbi:3-deoxy-7-phosphoheptulonate synthase, partial [Vibrio parahaemolyticus EKP-028]
QSMRCRQPLLATALWVSTVKVKLRCSQPKVTRMAT